jgi:leader peptidase (prepilin peptidase)/N-methyltransferase
MILLFVAVFVIGAFAGTFIATCATRLPYEKSLLWPDARCPLCRQPIAWYDRVPLLSYLLLRGRCRTCSGKVPWLYPATELGTGLAFVGLFYLEMVANVLRLPLLSKPVAEGAFPLPPAALLVFVHHAVLLCLLIAASITDLEHMEIPLTITIPGTFIGLVLSALLPWPYPEPASALPPFSPLVPVPPVSGAYPWPVWYPLPDWLPAGSWQLGLASGLAGAVVGMVLLRAVRFLFAVGRGVEGLGVGDADLMMMAGAFVGWQAVTLGFFVAVFPALVFALMGLILRGEQMIPFGPSLGLGALITVLAWPMIGRHFGLLFFDRTLIGVLSSALVVGLLAISYLFRLMRGRSEEKA